MSAPLDDAPGSVEIDQSGRGGSIYYREGPNTITFDWEFALPPAIVLIFGPNAKGWDASVPWAAGRQAAIYERVGADVVVMQVEGGSHVVDLDAGVIEILRPVDVEPPRVERAPRKSKRKNTALDAFKASVIPDWETWPEGKTYDLDALRTLAPEERDEAVSILATRDTTPREVEALDLVETPEAQAALDAALRHHLSIETRLAAAEVKARRDPSFDLEPFLALQIRRIDRPANGLTPALRLAEQHDSPTIRQALLWASYNGTECAPAFASLLLRLCDRLPDPLDEATRQLLANLDLHNSYFTRKKAFDELCERIEMELDTNVEY